ncbi:hypothetical protein [Cysteiniphilum halobium]|uniref:hypothetical protein n=1 Tax=Cysteiniphilum halobium TaxID=2219059 RepID=UPI003F834F7F
MTHWTHTIRLGILSAQTWLEKINDMLAERLNKITLYTLFVGIVSIVFAMILTYYFPVVKQSHLAILVGEVTLVIPWLVFIACLLLSLFQSSNH